MKNKNSEGRKIYKRFLNLTDESKEKINFHADLIKTEDKAMPNWNRTWHKYITYYSYDDMIIIESFEKLTGEEKVYCESFKVLDFYSLDEKINLILSEWKKKNHSVKYQLSYKNDD